MIELKIIIGSTREGRAADAVVPWVVAKAVAHGAFEIDLLDLRDWPLPMFSENFETIGDFADPTFSDPIVKRWNTLVGAGEAFLFVTPEYNHSIPAVLKNAIDSVFVTFGFRGKPMASVAYSGGIAGGVRAIEHLAHIGIEAEMVPLRNSVVIPFVGRAFGPDAKPVSPDTEAAADIMLDDLAWWGRALNAARSEGMLPPAFARLAARRSAAN